MAKYLWREEYRIGDAEIDNQHRRLFELLDVLYEAVCRSEAPVDVKEVLDELVDYTRSHFYAEESLMRELDYPGLEKHCQAHEALMAEVQGKINAFERGDKILSIELLEFMHHWLADHILTLDREVADFCQRA